MFQPYPPQRYNNMEFSEIKEKFEGLTADQVCNLAKFGKDILEINGTVTLARCLLEVAPTLMDDSNYKEAGCIVLAIAKAAIELDHQCWSEHKTLLGLTGVNIDDYYYGLKGVQEIIVHENED